MKQWYEWLFEHYGEQYDRESFTQGTRGECDFFEQELNHDRSVKILDIGCGTGRHSIEMAKRGYSVTGIDLSEAMLKKAREKAKKDNLDIHFEKHDARVLPFENDFGAAIMICEGAFPLMETDEMNYEILKRAGKALKQNGKLIFTTLNGLYPIFHPLSDFHNQETSQGQAGCESGYFDYMTFRDYNITTFVDDDGNERRVNCSERYYIPSEITWLLFSLGFEKTNIYGAKLGAFSRKHQLTPEDYEMLVITQKS